MNVEDLMGVMKRFKPGDQVVFHCNLKEYTSFGVGPSENEYGETCCVIFTEDAFADDYSEAAAADCPRA